ncbi:MAG: hypothetical protein JRD71_08425 [Deltaproteobacteria bacterium]|nr:hypothetical protein [Deltaproteobacteria bacterium]
MLYSSVGSWHTIVRNTNNKNVISANAEVAYENIIRVKIPMAESKQMPTDDFWLFHDIEDEEFAEIRKFIDPDFDLSSLRGINKLFDKLNHLID